ncbi:hypothetical protein, partial [Escherichia coli]|uniref:hypothetical protein n=1 Tax=Escherichia coli TaxID=562 RepID=UPI00142D4267
PLTFDEAVEFAQIYDDIQRKKKWKRPSHHQESTSDQSSFTRKKGGKNQNQYNHGKKPRTDNEKARLS